MPIMKTRHPFTTAAVARTLGTTMFMLALGGCTAVAELAYDINLDQQENQCQRLRSQTEASACLARTRSAEAQAQASRKAASQESAAAPKPRPATDLCFTRSTGERVCPN